MSDLFRSSVQARLAKAPMLPPLPNEEEEDEAGDSVPSLPTGYGPPAAPSRTPRASRKRPPNPTMAPISASGFFDQAMQVSVPDSDLDVRVYYTPPKFEDGTVIVCHHGAGFSGLSFACMAKEITDQSRGECGVLAFDVRGHGKTYHSKEPKTPETETLDIEVLTADLVNLVRVIFADVHVAPSLVLVGHSLGGSVCVRACPKLQDHRFQVTGVAVVDVVEEFTLDALPLMHSLLNARPEGFDSVEEAIEWHVQTNTIRNPYSARVSVPSIVVPAPEGSPAYLPAYLWRISLRSTAPYWTSWFTGLSAKFLSSRTARLLILAGTERLDKELMIGQMQGKFQLVVIPGVGHLVHEDDPTRMAEVIIEFWRRNDRVVAGVKKVGEV
ncbi:protein phosphatase methylesterase [Epithele typhae]|uniref:protein phosphatase methylesterase n=1 Tax=Epithele typhae TaxID=378194 RepID=UPI00200787B2|nr:protein phosphatase methylesterase [Epithele typhae]KAH9933552.1 protein phosphatase methylesterase [Epithele typhae]